ncbi:MAG: hypothetical protein J5829_02090 [Lachnospiraceae bacterium]|nr:hypothetical protein [Lachnospiraceae bacterium]
MKENRKVISLILTAFIGVSMTLAGCAEKEASANYLDAHGMQFTKPGDFTFITAMHDEEKDTGDIEIKAFVVELGETGEPEGEDLPEGFKQVKAVFRYDLSASNGEAGTLMDGVFDGYSGVSFEFEDGEPRYNQHADVADVPEGYNRITANGKTYDIKLWEDTEVNYPEMVRTFVLTCPKDYDGAVFYVGYGSMEIKDKYDKVDKTKGLLTMDELPYFKNGHDYYLFSTKTQTE